MDLKPNIDEIKNKLLQLKKEIETFKNDIKVTMKKLSKLEEALNIFYGINNDIISKYEMKKRNYQILENLKLIDNNEIFSRLKEINKMIDFKNKISNIINLYNKIINKLTTSAKVVCLGESCAGKTAFISRYINNKFEDKIMKSNTAQFTPKTEWFEEEDQSIKFEIWDTPGQKKYGAITNIFCKDTPVFILLYDITDKNYFDEIRNYWIKQVKKFSLKDPSKKKII